MDSLIFGNILVELVRIFYRAVFDTGSTAGAFVLINVPRFFDKGNLEVPGFTFNFIDFGVSQDFYISLPVDLDQFRCKYSHGAVVGRECLVELGHMAADGG